MNHHANQIWDFRPDHNGFAALFYTPNPKYWAEEYSGKDGVVWNVYHGKTPKGKCPTSKMAAEMIARLADTPPEAA